MHKRIMTISFLGSLAVLNEIMRTQIQHTNSFKQCSKTVITQLLRLGSIKQQELDQNNSNNFLHLLTPDREKLLTTKTKKIIQIIKRFKNNQKQKIWTNLYIGAVHVVGSYFNFNFFCYSIIFYAIQSNVSLMNDMWALKRGNGFTNAPFKTISQLYLIGTSTICAITMLRYGFTKWKAHLISKNVALVKRQ